MILRKQPMLCIGCFFCGSKCRYAQKPCSTSIFTKRKRLIVSIPMVSKLSTLFGPSGETRTRGILLPKTSRKLCIFYSLFLASYFIKPLISSNFRSHRFFYFRSISGQISGHKSALPSKRNRSST